MSGASYKSVAWRTLPNGFPPYQCCKGEVGFAVQPRKNCHCPLDRVDWRFEAEPPDPLRASDFTCVCTWQGWLVSRCQLLRATRQSNLCGKDLTGTKQPLQKPEWFRKESAAMGDDGVISLQRQSSLTDPLPALLPEKASKLLRSLLRKNQPPIHALDSGATRPVLV